MDRAVALRDGAGSLELVERRLLEADRERAHGLRRLLGGERRQRAGVHAPGEQHADGNVGDQVRAHRVAQSRAALFEQLGLVVVAARLERAGAREALDRHAAVVPRERVTGAQLADVLEDREWRGDDVERQERLECVEVDVAVLERVELRRERELAVHVAIREWLDPEAVACERQPPYACVPHGDGEHAAQPLPEARAPLFVAVHEHLGVAARAEAVACALELVHQLAVVVDLAVLDDGDGPVLVRDRLVAARQVDDRKAARRDPDGAVDVRALRVGAAVVERLRHPPQPLGVDRATARGDSANPAHGERV